MIFMNLFYEEYPNSVFIHGKSIPIVTDFREYIKLLDMLKDTELSSKDKLCILSMYFLEPPSDKETAIKALSGFVAMQGVPRAGIQHSNPEDEEESQLEEKKADVFSFSIDYPYILAGFMRDYGIDLAAVKYLHWWKFRMLFDGLSEDTEIKQRIMYRSVDLSAIQNKEERKRIRKIQKSIELPKEALTDYEIGNAFV